MKIKPFPSSFFVENRKRLYEKLKPDSVVVLAGNHLVQRGGGQTYPFFQESNFWYLSGIELSDCFMILYPQYNKDSVLEMLFVKPRTEKEIFYNGEAPSYDELTAISGIQTVISSESVYDLIEFYCKNASSHYFLSDSLYSTNTPFSDISNDFALNMDRYFRSSSFENLDSLIAELRVIKQYCELERIRQSIDVTALAFSTILGKVKAGMNESDIEAEMNYVFSKNGSPFHAFSPIIAGGKNACTLHYEKNDSVLNSGELLLMDFGSILGNYCADCSRTIPIDGKFSPVQAKYYNAVLRVFKAAIKLFVTGTTIAQINEKVDELLRLELVDLGYDPNDLKKYYPHGVTHFIGIDVHDVGDTKQPLQKGMVLSCEPGLYFHDEKIGIRIETDVLVDDNPQDLMKHIPVEIDEIEKLMDKF